jgi:hypothetical protein
MRRLLLRLIEWLFISNARTILGPQLLTHLLDFPEDAKQIAAENLAAVLR